MKAQNTSLFYHQKEKFMVSKSDAGIFAGSFFLGLLSSESMALCFTLIIMTAFYHRDGNKTWISGGAFLIGSFFISFWNFYFHAVLLCIFALMLAFVRLLRGNLYFFFPIMTALTTLIHALVLQQDFLIAFQAMLLGYVLCIFSIKHMNVSADSFRLNGLIFGILLLSCGKIAALLPSPLETWVIVGIYALLAQTIDMGSLVLLLMAGSRLFSMGEYGFSWIIAMILVNSMKECGKGAQLFGFALPMVLASQRFDILAIAILLFLLTAAPLFGPLQELTQTDHDLQYERLQLASQKRLLEHQLLQFSQIFHSIAHFFEKSHEPEMEFVQGMAQSLELLSMQLKQSATTAQEEQVRIYHLLKGYHFPVTRVQVRETEKGQKQIELFLEECRRQDVEEVILPLLQVLIDRNLKVVSRYRPQLLGSSVRIELCGTIPYQLKTQQFQKRKMEEANGDTCSVFRFRHSTICTLSDGMGAGEEAARSSSFITQLTQRLFAAGIPVEMAVQSMNALLRLHQEESFATLDLFVLDGLGRQAYLSKSGACATFLLRNHQVLKIQGESLPLGIIRQVAPDCYQIECYPGDVFVMFSDGIAEEKLESWLLSADRTVLAEELKKHLETMEAEDDVTVLLAEIDSR